MLVPPAPDSSPWVFGYGSLIYEPAFPEAIVEVREATLHGYRRRLNQASPGRGIPESLATGPALPGWRQGDTRLSLAFGTEPDPHSAIEGVVVRYPAELWPDVRAALQRREGCGPEWPVDAWHYEEAAVPVVIDGLHAPHPALTFLSLPDGAQTRSLTDAEVVAVLRHATPHTVGAKRKGMHYVEGLGPERIARDRWLQGIIDALRA
jgi:cation transport regulator ChaC